MILNRSTLLGMGGQIGGAVQLCPSPSTILSMVVAVNVAVLLLILFSARLDLATGPQAARPGGHAVSPAARAGSGRAPTAEPGAPQIAAGASDSPSLPKLPAAVFDLIRAIGLVESGNADSAVGDGGRSRGRYQISRAYWIDGGGDPKRYEKDVLNSAICRRVMLAYWERYCPAALFGGDLETLARIHNGGPRGRQKVATQEYWLKVKGKMR